jgi:hypothetical protein
MALNWDGTFRCVVFVAADLSYWLDLATPENFLTMNDPRARGIDARAFPISSIILRKPAAIPSF